ncbi:MAG: 50S ribosomal protein L11 methyltransferase [Flavobacteriaceae bacterium]
MSNYIGVYFKFENFPAVSEALVAELGQLEFESFVEEEGKLEAYIPEETWDPKLLKGVYVLNSGEFEITYEIKNIEQVNWNEQWEKNFDPLEVDGKVYIRAPFHPHRDLAYEIVIEPKMSFGTGHHETTHLMIQHLLDLDLTGKKVLDMGSGTGILAIFSEMRGASAVDAIDIDQWCFENAIENIERNNAKYIRAEHGAVELLQDRSYDLVIANINRNILLEDMPAYIETLMSGGVLLLSGFYSEDLDLIKEKAEQLGMSFISVLDRNNWNAAKFVKK